MQTRYINRPVFRELARNIRHLHTRLGLGALRAHVCVAAKAAAQECDVPSSLIIVSCPSVRECKHPEAPCGICGGYGAVPLPTWRDTLLDAIDTRLLLIACSSDETFDQSFSDDGIPF